jgi:hypothetical protein
MEILPWLESRKLAMFFTKLTGSTLGSVGAKWSLYETLREFKGGM